MTDEEQELVSQIRTGEFSAFRRLMEKHQQKIYYLALDMTGNLHDAEDLTQEIFIKAFKGLPKFRGDAKLSSWLYRIAINTIIDKHRKKDTVLFMDYEKPVDNNVSWNSQENPEKSAESWIMRRHIDHALQRLSNRERSVFVLRHYNDLPLQEIAENLGLSLGTVKSLIFRTIRKLQHELAFYRHELD